MTGSALELGSLASMYAPSVTWKGKLLQLSSWLRVLRTDPWMRLLSGQTFEHSTAQRGADRWICSLRGTRVSLSAAQGSAKGKKIRGISSLTLQGSRKNLSRRPSSSRMWKGISLSASVKSSKAYMEWVTKLKRTALARRKLALLTYASGSSLWPTATLDAATDRQKRYAQGGLPLTVAVRLWPTANAGAQPRGKNFTKADGHYKPHDLVTAVKQWRTPDAPTSGGIRTRTGSQGKGHQVVLAEQAATWRSPNTRDHHAQGPRVGHAQRQLTLVDQVKGFRSSHLVRKISRAGAGSSEATLKLNPLFVELLMGLPLGWTDYAPLGMESFHWWLRSHSERFRDVWELMSSSDLLDPK